MEESLSIPSLIVKLVAQCSPEPELGARLKQRLNRDLKKLGHPRFDENEFGYRKFAAYLEGTLSTLITVVHPKSSGDIQVYLKASRPATESNVKPEKGSALRLRSDVWRAFTNPDPKRSRYYDRETSAVHHFSEEDSQKMLPALESKGAAFVEIKRIDSETQLGWMRGFLDTQVIDGAQRQKLTELLADGYSSQANAEFTELLGEHEDQWRRLRTHYITEVIKAWAIASGIAMDQLLKPAAPAVLKPAPVPTEVSSLAIAPRRQVELLLAKMDDSDITAFVIPTLLSHLLAASRI